MIMRRRTRRWSRRRKRRIGKRRWKIRMTRSGGTQAVGKEGEYEEEEEEEEEEEGKKVE